MHLTERQKKFLRKTAHNMKPIVTVGDKGVTEGLISELNSALEHHELIKVKVRVGDRDARDEVIGELTGQSGSELISRVGNIATLYKPNKKDPKLNLPKAG